jgi:hypothetical protein
MERTASVFSSTLLFHMVPVNEIFRTEFHMDFLFLPCVPSGHVHFPTELELDGFLTEPKFVLFL